MRRRDDNGTWRLPRRFAPRNDMVVFTQVRRFERPAKLKFEPPSMSFRATEGSREIYALMERLQSNWCQDPSIPLRFTRDDSAFCCLKQLDKLKFGAQNKKWPPSGEGGQGLFIEFFLIRGDLAVHGFKFPHTLLRQVFQLRI